MSNDNIRIFVADDHHIVIDGLRTILSAEPMMDVVGVSTDSKEVVERIHNGEASNWDVLILDLDIPPLDGWIVLEVAIKACPQLAIILYTRQPEERCGKLAFGKGVAAFISKEKSTSELIQAIRVVHDGEYYHTDKGASHLEHRRSSVNIHEMLSEQEMSVFLLVAQGYSPGEISAELGLAKTTVSTYLKRIRDKMGLTSNGEIIAYAVRAGLI